MIWPPLRGFVWARHFALGRGARAAVRETRHMPELPLLRSPPTQHIRARRHHDNLTTTTPLTFWKSPSRKRVKQHGSVALTAGTHAAAEKTGKSRPASDALPSDARQNLFANLLFLVPRSLAET